MKPNKLDNKKVMGGKETGWSSGWGTANHGGGEGEEKHFISE